LHSENSDSESELLHDINLLAVIWIFRAYLHRYYSDYIS